jgi:hypothetical protein
MINQLHRRSPQRKAGRAIVMPPDHVHLTTAEKELCSMRIVCLSIISPSGRPAPHQAAG